MTEQPVSERIAQMVEYYAKGNKSAFAKAVGISNQSLGEIVGSRKSAPSFAALQKICTAFPEVRMEWLIMGKGEMLPPKPTEWKDPFEVQEPKSAGTFFPSGFQQAMMEATRRDQEQRDLLAKVLEKLIDAAPPEQAEQARTLFAHYTFTEREDSYYIDKDGNKIDDYGNSVED